MRTDDRPTVMAVCSKLWRSKITVEPTVVIFYILYDFILFFENNLLLQKSCRNVSLIVEPDLNTPCDNEQLGQQYTAMANSIRTSTMYVLATVSSVFWSVWSDNHGRDCRPMLYLPLIGMVVQCCFDLANSYYWHWDPSLVTYVSAIVQGVSGSKVSMYLGALLYLANVIRVEDRSFRFGLLLALEYGSILIGSGLAGYVNRGLGFSGSFAVCLVLAIGALLVSYVKIKDPTVPCDDTDEKKKKKLSIAQSLNPLLLLEGIPIVFRKRSGNKRAVLICLLLVGPPYTVSLFGEQTVTYLYFRYRFGWQEKAYSVYTAYKMLGTLFGTMFCTVYMSKYLKIHDGFIGTLAAFWDTVGNISYFFADQAWELYVIPLYNIFNGVLFAMMASLSTKCVEPNEMGYLTSVRSLMQIVSPLSFPLYGLVYRTTLDVLPQAFFLLSVLFNFPTIILFGIAYYLSKDIVFETPDTSVTAAVDNTTTPPAVNPAAAVTDGLPHHQNGEMKKSIES